MSLPASIFENARVLIVDDEETTARMLKRILESSSSFDIRTETDPRRTQWAYQEFRPDILLLDLNMPHLDGFAVMEQLRAIIPDEKCFPILVMTGDESVETKLRALASGAKDFLSKPLEPTEVALRIRNLLETRFLQLELRSQNVLLEERVRDRTEQLEATLHRLHATQHQSIRQERLGALGVMASGIAHDFNNSLTAILGFGELLLEYPERTEYLQTILSAAQDARQTVRRLREFYRSDAPDEPSVAVNLNALAEHAISLTRPRWSNQALAAGIRINALAELGKVPLVAGNPAELREVLMNLIFNAVDAVPKGGTIRVKTRTEGRYAVLQVVDNGVGMDSATVQRCLEPFFTTKGEAGTGLGLSMVHGIVQRHGGTIELASEPDAGTTVTLRFPAVGAMSSTPEQPPTAPELERSLQILLIDDQPIICELVAELLRTDGHVVDTAGGGGAALSLCRRKDYDLFITDLAMPGMNGEQLADVIKQLTPAKPVILLTGFGDLLKDGRSTPSIDLVVHKPATLTDLRRAIFDVMTRERFQVAAA